MGKRILVEFDLGDPVQRKQYFELIGISVVDGQQKLSGPPMVGGEEGPVFVPCTDPQRRLMDKHHIRYDDKTSKDEASSRISGFFEKIKTGGG